MRARTDIAVNTCFYIAQNNASGTVIWRFCATVPLAPYLADARSAEQITIAIQHKTLGLPHQANRPIAGGQNIFWNKFIRYITIR